MAEIKLEIKKSDFKEMSERANAVLELQGIDPDTYWYKKQLEVVMEGTTNLVKTKKLTNKSQQSQQN